MVIFLPIIQPVFAYRITYDLNGGQLPNGDTNYSTETNGNEVVLDNPVRSGFTFAGWCEATDAADGVCDSPLGATEENGVISYRWVIPSSINSDTDYIALWNFGKNAESCPDANNMVLSGYWMRLATTGVDFNGDGIETRPNECAATLLYATNPSALIQGDYLNAGIEAFTFCKYNMITHSYTCSAAVPLCSQEQIANFLSTMYGASDEDTLDWFATLVYNDENATRNDLVFNQPSNNITVLDMCPATCEVEITVLNAPMCLVTDVANATEPALIVRQGNNKYYINLTEEINSENPTHITTQSSNVLRVIAGEGQNKTVYNAYGEAGNTEN